MRSYPLWDGPELPDVRPPCVERLVVFRGIFLGLAMFEFFSLKLYCTAVQSILTRGGALCLQQPLTIFTEFFAEVLLMGIVGRGMQRSHLAHTYLPPRKIDPVELLQQDSLAPCNFIVFVFTFLRRARDFAKACL